MPHIKDLHPGDNVIVNASNRRSDGSHGIITEIKLSPGAAPRAEVMLGGGQHLSYRADELIKKPRPL